MPSPCPACGALAPSDAHTCAGCGQRLTAAAPLPERASAPAHPAAIVAVGFARRALARGVDLLLCGFFAGLLAGMLLLGLGDDPAVFERELPLGGLGMWLIQTAMMVVYHGVAESVGGTTLGKLLLGLQVVGDQGEPLPISRGLLRNAWVPIDGLLFGLVAFVVMRQSPRRQRLGDRFAHSLVLRRAELPELARPTPLAVAHGIVLGLALASAICALGFLLLAETAPLGPTA